MHRIHLDAVREWGGWQTLAYPIKLRVTCPNPDCRQRTIFDKPRPAAPSNPTMHHTVPVSLTCSDCGQTIDAWAINPTNPELRKPKWCEAILVYPAPLDLPPGFVQVPPEISSISSTFAKTYTQVLAAEQQELDELIGIGLRKALEFLVKDFAITEYPGDSAAIQKASLKDCIEQYIGDVDAKACAHRAAWLGNDFTHYLRLWPEKDLLELKKLISLTVFWITNALKSRASRASMPSPRHP